MGRSRRIWLDIRHRLHSSDGLARLLGWLLWAYIAFCWRTSRWQSEGEDALDAALARGPVAIIFWHQHLMLVPAYWQRRAALAGPRDPSPAGTLAATTTANFGAVPFAVDLKGGNFGPVRGIIKLVRGGTSLALTGDGPMGPRNVAKQSTIDWVRAAGRPVFATGWSQTRPWRLGSWDKLMVPKPFGRGAFVFRPVSDGLAKAADGPEADALRADVARWMEDATNRARELADG